MRLVLQLTRGLYVEGFDNQYNEWLRKRSEIYHKRTENTKKNISAVPEKKTELLENFIRTGKLVGDMVNGKREKLDLHDITINKCSPNYHGIYDMDKMKEKIEKAFSGRVSDVRLLMDKMYHANDDEKEMFISIFEEYLNYPESNENNAKVRILAYITEQAEIYT